MVEAEEGGGGGFPVEEEEEEEGDVRTGKETTIKTVNAEIGFDENFVSYTILEIEIVHL